MRNFLGESATQAGSLNAPGRLRFDFNTPGAVPPSVLRDVEQQVNEVLLQRPRGARVHHLAGRGAPARRDGAVRREVRRRGPGRRGRRLRPRAVRRYARGPLRPARPGQDPARVVDRLRRAPGRGAGRPRRVRLPGPRAPAGVPAGRAVPGTQRAGRRPGRADRRPRCATPRRSWRSCARQLVLGRGRRLADAALATSRGVAYVAPRRPRARRQRRAYPRPGDPRPDPRRRPGGGRGGGPGRRQGVAGRRRQRGRPDRGLSAQPTWSRARCPAGAAATPTWPRAAACRPSEAPNLLAAVERRSSTPLESEGDHGCAPWRRAVRPRRPGRPARGGCREGQSRRSSSDPDGILATPVITLRPRPATGQDGTRRYRRHRPRWCGEYEAVEVIVRLPVTLPGPKGSPRRDVRDYAASLARAVEPVPVRLADERMSTVVASRRLSERGVRGRRQRAVVDQAAAVEILQGWLTAQRRRT